MPAFVQYTERVSVNSSGIEGSSYSDSISMSSDGRFVAFRSRASNLAQGDTNHVSDIFVHDRRSGATTRISVDSTGIQGNKASLAPSISPDGRFVAFESNASNLVPGDTNGFTDIFVHDRKSHQTTRVSIDSGGIQGNNFSMSPCISSSGRFVAFMSGASNLVAADTNSHYDIFVHDCHTGQTTRISVDSAGQQGNGRSDNVRISHDGRFATFVSDASNLVPGDSNGFSDIFVRDLQTHQTTRVSVDSAGIQGNYFSSAPSISSNGRCVAFMSGSTNLVLGDANGSWDTFVHDRQTGVTSRVSVDSRGVAGNNGGENSGISADGRFVAFNSWSNNLVPGDTSGNDVFVHDRQTGHTIRVSVDSNGGQQNGNSNYSDPHISFDGRIVAFASDASNLVSGDTNYWWDIFINDSRPIMPRLDWNGHCPGVVTLNLDAATPEGGVVFAIGAAGSFILTSSVCTGTIIDIGSPRLGPVVRASWLGTIVRSYHTSPAMCGLTVQALDIRTCIASNAVVL